MCLVSVSVSAFASMPLYMIHIHTSCVANSSFQLTQQGVTNISFIYINICEIVSCVSVYGVGWLRSVGLIKL